MPSLGEDTIEGGAWRQPIRQTRGKVRRGQLFPTRGALAIALLVCVLAPTILGAMQINASPGFSPIDEAAHLDYVDRIAAGGVPRQGQRLRASTLRELACRGLPLLESNAALCTAQDLEPDQFPGGAYQYEAQQPPTYYVLSVPMRWVTQNVLGIRDKLDATRATSIVWLVAGLLLAWAAGRVMGIDPLPLGAALLLLAAAPTVVYGAGTVSNDATAVPAGGLVALVAAVALRRDGSRVPIMLFLAGFVAAAGKTTNLLAVATVSAALAVAAITGRASAERWTATLRRWLRDGGALLLGGAISAGTWVVVHRSLSLIDVQDEPAFGFLRDRPHTVGVVLREAAGLFELLTGSFVSPDTLAQDVQVPFSTALSFLIIGAALSGLFVSPRRWSHVLGLVALPVLYVGGVVFGLGVVISHGIDPGLGGRYGVSLAPLLILVLAASLAGTWSQRAITVFATAMFLTTFAVMVI